MDLLTNWKSGDHEVPIANTPAKHIESITHSSRYSIEIPRFLLLIKSSQADLLRTNAASSRMSKEEFELN